MDKEVEEEICRESPPPGYNSDSEAESADKSYAKAVRSENVQAIPNHKNDPRILA